MIEASTFSGGGTGCGPAADAVFHHPVGGGALLTERATTISGCRFFYNAARQVRGRPKLNIAGLSSSLATSSGSVSV